MIPFRLVLAKRNASCNATSGIVQVNITSTYPQYSTKGLNSDNTDGVSADQARVLSRWDTNLYYNIYVINTFDSVPLSNTAGLQGYASFPTNPAMSNPQTLTVACTTNTNNFSVWIDYNNNGNFESSKLVVNNQSVAPGTNTNLNFNIPATGVMLNTPLRMRIIADSNDMSSTPCGQLAYGQVEDYEVSISSSMLATQDVNNKSQDFVLYPNPSENGMFYIKHR